MPSYRINLSLTTSQHLRLPLAEVSQDILIARPDVRRTMGLPDLVLPVNAGFLVMYCLVMQSCVQEIRRRDNVQHKRASRVKP